MSKASVLAARFREVYLEGTWVVGTNLIAQIENVSWRQVNTKIGSLNTIAALVYHLDYYIAGLVPVFSGHPLKIRDKFSFDFPPINSSEDWLNLRERILKDINRFNSLLEDMSDDKLNESFVDPKYGTYERNINAIIEHGYYHLGQIVLIKKMLLDQDVVKV